MISDGTTELELGTDNSKALRLSMHYNPLSTNSFCKNHECHLPQWQSLLRSRNRLGYKFHSRQAKAFCPKTNPLVSHLKGTSCTAMLHSISILKQNHRRWYPSSYYIMDFQ